MTCTEDSKMCSSCADDGFPYLREDDSSCITLSECGDGYFLDIPNKLCKCT